MAHGKRRESSGPPGQQDVDGYIRAVIVGEGVAQISTKGSKGADLARGFAAQSVLQREFGDAGSNVASESVGLRLWSAINDVIAFVEVRQEVRNFFRGRLQIVIDGDDDGVTRRSDAAQERIVLPVVAHQIESADSGMMCPESLNHFPVSAPASIVQPKQFAYFATGIECVR